MTTTVEAQVDSGIRTPAVREDGRLPAEVDEQMQRVWYAAFAVDERIAKQLDRGILTVEEAKLRIIAEIAAM